MSVAARGRKWSLLAAGVAFLSVLSSFGLEARISGDLTLARALDAAAAKGADLSPAMQVLGRYMVQTSIPQNFRQGGRPNRWDPVTRYGEAGVQPLLDQGRLVKSVGYKATAMDLMIGAGDDRELIYARLQNEGSAGLPGGVVRPTHGRYLAIPQVPPLLKTEAWTRGPRDFASAFIIRGPQGLGVYRKASGSAPDTSSHLASTTGRRSSFRTVEMIFRLVTQVRVPARRFLLFQEEDKLHAAALIMGFVFDKPQWQRGRFAA